MPRNSTRDYKIILTYSNDKRSNKSIKKVMEDYYFRYIRALKQDK